MLYASTIMVEIKTIKMEDNNLVENRTILVYTSSSPPVILVVHFVPYLITAALMTLTSTCIHVSRSRRILCDKSSKIYVNF